MEVLAANYVILGARERGTRGNKKVEQPKNFLNNKRFNTRTHTKISQAKIKSGHEMTAKKIHGPEAGSSSVHF